VYDTSGGGGAFSWAFGVIYLVALVLLLIAAWQVFTKAGKPGWACLIPFYNAYVVLKIVGRPGWWLVLYFIPLVNIVIWIVVTVDLSHSFGQGGWFAVGLLFLPFIFLPILAFGASRYLRPAALGPVAPPAAPAPQWTPPAVPPPPPAPPAGSGA
jgi:Family of unknown function (DUF5684)